MFDFLNTSNLPQSSLRKQVIDQGGHFMGGIALAFLLSIFLPSLGAIALVAAFAIAREVFQHGSFDLGKGSLMDITFWTIGALVGGLIA